MWRILNSGRILRSPEALTLTRSPAVFSGHADIETPPRPARSTPRCATGLSSRAEDETEDDLATYIKANYTKYEYEIPMRDGKRMFTSVYVPKDDSRDYAIMLKRTPYSISPYGVDHYAEYLGPSETFAREGFIFAFQDVRGRYMSEGEFIEVTPHKEDKQGPGDVDESSDTYDTIDWLVDNIPATTARSACGAFPIPASTSPPA